MKKIFVLFLMLVLSVSFQALAQSSDGGGDSGSGSGGSSESTTATVSGSMRYLGGSSASGGGGGASGSGSSAFSVDDSTGAAKYEFDLKVPPGINGLEPSLKLIYNSQAGNPGSPVGYGWNLSYGHIERLSEQGHMDLANGTRFRMVLNGSASELVLQQENIDIHAKYGITPNMLHPYEVDEYVAKTEMGYSIYLHVRDTYSYRRTVSTIEDHWIVIDRNGYQFQFGTDYWSRVAKAEDCSQLTGYTVCDILINKWKLTLAQDTNGNQIEFSHYSDNYLYYIKYAGVTIDFEYYDSETEEHPIFPNAKKFSDYKDDQNRLKAIHIGTYSDHYQSYNFTYDVKGKNKFVYLESLTQSGRTSGESLPPTVFEYYGDDDHKWSTQHYSMRARTNTTHVDDPGWISHDNQFIDMNADGLLDKVVTQSDSEYIQVFFNDGFNFEFVPGRSNWKDPFSTVTHSCEWGINNCSGSLNSFYKGNPNDWKQWRFLMDMNGDSLPDRVKVVDVSSGRRALEIAFNTGQAFSTATVTWNDPYEGGDAGYSTNDKFYMDMNGDGLVDRVVGDTEDDVFKIYYNNGQGFETTAEEWSDPVSSSLCTDTQPGKKEALNGVGVTSFIRDFNGDGLPDRICRGRVYGNGIAFDEHFGIIVFFNRLGEGWSSGTGQSTTGLLYHNTWVIADPSFDEDEGGQDQRGYITEERNWMDMNNDGFLDRVISDHDEGEIIVHYFQGHTPGDTFASFGPAVHLKDPVSDRNTTAGFKGKGYIYQYKDRSDEEGDDIHTLTIDINGDGYPDRLTVHARNDENFSKVYKVYPMVVNNIEFSNTPTQWSQQEVPQPSGSLKSITDSFNQKMVIEYLPSTWPRRWDVAHGKIPMNHRFLPSLLYVIHRSYSTDWGITANDSEPEALRNPGLRWIEYDFWGGNITFQATSGYPLKQFNGFHEVSKRMHRFSDETWDEFEFKNYYMHTKGTVSVLSSGDESYFNQNSYGHIALAGRPYISETYEGAQLLVESENTYSVTNSTNQFACSSLQCFAQLDLVTKTTKELGSSHEKVSSISFEYDQYMNVTRQVHYDGSGTAILEQENEYYVPSDFNQQHQIKNRPYRQVKKLGSQEYRKKEFVYDANGNPTHERWYYDPTHYVEVTRTFNGYGVVTEQTNVDGVQKQFGYAITSNQPFPIKERTILPTGAKLTDERLFDRYTGNVLTSINSQGVGLKKDYDSFGRVTNESLIDVNGNEVEVKRYEYEYVTATLNGWSDLKLMKTQVWEYVEGQPDSLTKPSAIMYIDAAGNTLQNCQLSERGNYRRTQARKLNAGRTDVNTSPIFTSTCSFQTSLNTAAKTYKTFFDFQGRVLSKDLPAGESNSPTGSMNYEYTVNSNGHFQKNLQDSLGRKSYRYYDDMDRLVKIKDHLGKEIEYEYNPVGDLLSLSVDGVEMTRITYDMMGQKKSVTDANFGTITYNYDQNARLKSQQDAAGNVTTFFYDTMSRVERKEFYDAASNLERYEVYEYDSGDSEHSVVAGELYRVVEYKGDDTLLRETKFSYGNDFRKSHKITRALPGLGEFTQTFEYDAYAIAKAVHYPGGQSLYYKYLLTGMVGQICSQDDCAGEGAEVYYTLDAASSFDAMGSIVSETYGNGVVQEFEFYENSRRLKNKTVKKDTTIYSQRSYTYDAYSNILSIQDPLNSNGTGAIQSAEYDTRDRLISYIPQGTTVAKRFEFNEQGNLLQNSLNFGSDAYEYNSSKPHAVTDIGSRHYDYDVNGNLIKDPERELVYNAQNQLMQVKMNNGAIIDFDYDYEGNRVLKTISRRDAYHHLVNRNIHYIGDALEIHDDKLMFHIYANKKKVATKELGSLSEIVVAGLFKPSGQTTGIQLASLGSKAAPSALLGLVFLMLFALRLVRSELPGFVVTASYRNKRVRAAHLMVAKVYLFLRNTTKAILESLSLLHKNLFRKTVALTLCLLFISFIPLVKTAEAASRAPVKTDDPVFVYIHNDHLGSSHVWTEGQSEGAVRSGTKYNRGALVQRIEYNPYGQERYVLNPNLNLDPSYTSQQYDKDTGLYYYNARYYDPKLARFVQADTMIPDTQDDQSYNRYSYVRGNPLKYSDPSGHGFWDVFKAFFAGLALGFITAFLTPIISAALINAGMTTLLAGMVANGVAGMVAGFVSGLINGGIQGALDGMATGLVYGILQGAGELKGLKTVMDSVSAIAGAINLGLSAASGEMAGLAAFSGILLGGSLGDFYGQKIGKSISKTKAGQGGPSTQLSNVDQDRQAGASWKSPTKDGMRQPDSQGKGHFLASRGPTRKHKGVDYISTAGQDVYAPFDAEVTYIGNYNGMKTLSFKNQELEGRLLYLESVSVKVGDTIKYGSVVGVAADMTKKYGAGMTNHIHFQASIHGKFVDPQKWINFRGGAEYFVHEINGYFPVY